MTHRITVMPGDGIGPEVVEATLKVLEATGVPFVWDFQPIGERALKERGALLSDQTLESIRRIKVGIKGPTGTPLGDGHRSINVTLRERFQLYANIRPVRTVPGVWTRYSDLPVDIVSIRENTQDIYIGEESEDKEGATALSRITRLGTERIARAAFNYARAHNRKKMTIVHKANILKKTHGLFRSVAYEIAKKFPEIECNDLIADNCFMQLVMRPERFDVLLLPNFLGDLASDLCAGLTGGLGLAPGANIGDTVAIFEAVHGTAPDIAGKGLANPTALILSGAMMLDHLNEQHAGDAVRHAVYTVLEKRERVTGDIKQGGVSTTEYTDEVIRQL